MVPVITGGTKLPAIQVLNTVFSITYKLSSGLSAQALDHKSGMIAP